MTVAVAVWLGCAAAGVWAAAGVCVAAGDCATATAAAFFAAASARFCAACHCAIACCIPARRTWYARCARVPLPAELATSATGGAS